MATDQHNAKTRSLQGRFLVASPYADKSPYRRFVILLLEHNEQGAAGVLMNGSFSQSLGKLRDHMGSALPAANRQAAALGSVSVPVAMWKPGQLDLEVASGLWLNMPADPSRMTAGKAPDWADFVREIGRSVYRDALGISGFPRDAALN